jgi:Asp-tRNA(Asn)/Glu-tRNA(Gln) amidotransferase A subunit family amidase
MIRADHSMTYPLGTIASISEAYKNGLLTVKEVVSAHLDQIQSHDDKIGAYQTVFSEKAMQMADAADKSIKAGYRLGPHAWYSVCLERYLSSRRNGLH